MREIALFREPRRFDVDPRAPHLRDVFLHFVPPLLLFRAVCEAAVKRDIALYEIRRIMNITGTFFLERQV